MASKTALILIGLMASFSLGSCAGVSQNKKSPTTQISTQQGLTKMVPGKTTQTDVVNELGLPGEKTIRQGSHGQIESWDYFDRNGGQWATFTFDGQNLRSVMWIPKPNELKLSLDYLKKDFPTMNLARGQSLPSGPDVVGVQDTNFQDKNLGITVLLHEPSNDVVAISRFVPDRTSERIPSSSSILPAGSSP